MALLTPEHLKTLQCGNMAQIRLANHATWGDHSNPWNRKHNSGSKALDTKTDRGVLLGVWKLPGRLAPVCQTPSREITTGQPPEGGNTAPDVNFFSCCQNQPTP